MSPTLSIIIPTLNEEHTLGKTLTPLVRAEDCEVIVVDAGSSDQTLDVARQSGCKTIAGSRGRSRQLNRGAAAAQGELLLFVHADTLLPNHFCQLVADTLRRPAVAAGAFSLAITSPARSLAAIAFLANLRSRLLHLPYGDQAIFTSRDKFTAVGGFPELDIMEDFVFIRQMKKLGRIIILAEKAETSARRWQNMGIVRTTLINQLIVCGYGLGVSPTTLARWYKRAQGLGRRFP